METVHNDREACWNEMLERWNELSWCAHAFHETDMIAAKILLWRDITCEQPLTDAPASGGGHDATRRSSILPEGLRMAQVGGRAVWWLLLSTAAAVGRALS
ncbi:MAG: hypothetical protein F4045_01190 [Chloroflexi bacterium]|nr:hypothetical protein [Chloroflexota bacterium]MYK33756.1 hypothetical protein [Chloroflexota bacterium]